MLCLGIFQPVDVTVTFCGQFFFLLLHVRETKLSSVALFPDAHSEGWGKLGVRNSIQMSRMGSQKSNCWGLIHPLPPRVCIRRTLEWGGSTTLNPGLHCGATWRSPARCPPPRQMPIFVTSFQTTVLGLPRIIKLVITLQEKLSPLTLLR